MLQSGVAGARDREGALGRWTDKRVPLKVTNDVDAIFRAQMRALAHKGGAATKRYTAPIRAITALRRATVSSVFQRSRYGAKSSSSVRCQRA